MKLCSQSKCPCGGAVHTDWIAGQPASLTRQAGVVEFRVGTMVTDKAEAHMHARRHNGSIDTAQRSTSHGFARHHMARVARLTRTQHTMGADWLGRRQAVIGLLYATSTASPAMTDCGTCTQSARQGRATNNQYSVV